MVKKKLNIASAYDVNLKTVFIDRINCCVSLCAHVLGQILGTYIVACTVFKEGVLPVDPGYDVSG